MNSSSRNSKSLIIQKILKKHEGKLLRYAQALISDEETAREIVQDTFLSLWKENIEKLEKHILPWLFRVCRNNALDIYRKERRMRQLQNNDSLRVSTDIVERSNSISFILKKFDLLPKKQKDVLLLKFQNDLSYNEISEITGLSVSNVGYLIHMGIKAIRQMTESQSISDRRTL